MGQTTPDALRWPELGDPANVPQDMQELAADVQTALNARTAATNGKRALSVPYSGFSTTTDVALTADTAKNLTFESTFAQPPDSAASVVKVLNQWSRFTVQNPGKIHRLELDVTVRHGTVGTARTFEVGINDGGGATASATFTAVQATSGQGVRLPWHLTQPPPGSFYVYVKPMGAAATGWSVIYARLALIGV